MTPKSYYNGIKRAYPDLEYINAGIDGAKSGDLASLIRKPEYTKWITRSRIITLSIGSNDLLALGKELLLGAMVNIEQTLRNLNSNLMVITNYIRILNPQAVVKIATIYNPLSRSNQQVQQLSHRVIMAANTCIEGIVRQFQVIVVPVHKAFWKREELFLGRNLHPNIIGHRVIAEMFMKY